MAAHLRKINRARCDCGQYATQTLLNRYNAIVAFYCDTHAAAALIRFKHKEGEDE